MIPLHEIVLDENGAISSEQHDLQLHLLWCVSEHAYINLTVGAVEKVNNTLCLVLYQRRCTVMIIKVSLVSRPH